MVDGTWSLTGKEFGGAQNRHVRQGGGLQRTTALRMLGEVVYAARLADGKIKFGHTERFDLRLHWLKHHVKQDVELLAFRVGSYEDEQSIHSRLESHRAIGTFYANSREYYEPHPEVLSVVNAMRDDLNMPRLAA